jgi:hypothetical protein
MPREVEPSLNEKQFFAKALQENIRLDGRAFDQFRALELDFGDVRLGKTRYAMHFVLLVYPLVLVSHKENDQLRAKAIEGLH